MTSSKGRYIISRKDALKKHDGDEKKLLESIYTFIELLHEYKGKIQFSIENKDTSETIRLCNTIHIMANSLSCQGIAYTSLELKSAAHKPSHIMEEYGYLLTSIALFERFVKVNVY